MNKINKNILVLSTLDERGKGHGWSHYQFYKSLGFNADYICLLRSYPDTKKYVIDRVHPINLRYGIYKLVQNLSKLLFFPYPDMRAWYKGINFADADSILKRMEFRPDYIVVCTFNFFLSAKSFYKLWKATGATFVFVMCDEKLMTGGCPYPIGCKEYENGCADCPQYHYAKFITRRVVRQKEKYFSRFPFHVLGTRYDIKKAEKVKFLSNKLMHTSVSVPAIPFVKSKAEARQEMNFPDDDFILMCGAVTVEAKIKGFCELVDSLGKFSSKISPSRKVTLLIAGEKVPNINWPQNINVIRTGYLNLDRLFTCYYACDLYLSPSILDSGPMMVNYAIACGRPVVAFEVGVALDLVVQRKTGWLAETSDTGQFAEGIEYFYKLSDSELKIAEEYCKKHIKSFLDKPWYEFMMRGE